MALFIGGNKLGRGVTIKNLLVSYYGRNPKRAKADTVLQHARMYGYRKKDLGVLLISDVVMPQLSGIDLAFKLKEKAPACKILLFSGQAATLDPLVSAREGGHDLALLSDPRPPHLSLQCDSIAEKLGSSDGASSRAVVASDNSCLVVSI